MTKVIYASDLDRTLIFSERFILENPTDKPFHAVEFGEDGEPISYIADDVEDKLEKIINSNNALFVPVTSRSTEEFNRIKFKKKPEYAIIANGGLILHNGEPIEEYSNFIESRLDIMSVLLISLEVKEHIHSVKYEPKFVDNRYVFFKTVNPEHFDVESEYLTSKFKEWELTRQKNKCYMVPKYFSKGIALQWLSSKLGNPIIVASGDSKLDYSMLDVADWKVVPMHSDIAKEDVIKACTFAEGGIISPIKAIDIVSSLSV